MPLLPRRSRSFAGGGQLGHDSQLGAGATSTGVAGRAGDALYQNLPPLAVPFISVKRADLDGVRADIQQEMSQKADKLGEDLRKLRDKALENAKMTAAGKARVVQSFDGFMTDINQRFAKDPALLASPSARSQVMQDYERALDRSFIQSNVNGMLGSTKLLADLGNERQSYGAYTPDGKRLNRSYSESVRDYQENEKASVNPLNLTVRDGTEKDALAAVDKLFTSPTSTFGTEHASVGVGQIQGSQGERYTVANSGGNTTTTNAPHINALRAAMIGYTDKKDKYHAGDWKSVLGENEVYGLEEPRLTKYDNAPLQPGEQVTIDLRGAKGEVQQVAVAGGSADSPLAGKSRRELLQYLEVNPTEANQKALRQLEQNRGHLAERDVKNLLATRLGLKLINGTVHKEGVSAARIAPEKEAADKTKALPSNLFAALSGGSPAFDKDAENGTYPILDKDGKALTTTGKDKAGKSVQVPLQISPAVTVIKGAEGVDEWANKFITMDGLVDGKNGRVPISLSSLPKQMAVYHVGPNGLRQIQGGNQLGALPHASDFKVIGQNSTITWLPKNPNRGMGDYKAGIERASQMGQQLKQRFDGGKITAQQYQQAFGELEQQAATVGLGPYLSVDVAATEETLLKATRPGDKDNGDTYTGRFGYAGKAGKAKRPDQLLGIFANNNDELQRDHGWEMLSTADEKQYGITPDTWKTGLGSKSYKTKMLIPATNLQFNSSSKVVNENVKQAELDAQEEKAVEVGTNLSTGSWGK